MWDNLTRILALVLIAEGLLPFMLPSYWRALVQRIAALGDGQIRFVGLTALLAGLLLLLLS